MWKKLPSWSLFGINDRMIHPDQQRRMAQRSRATMHEIEASHVPHLSQPDEVAQVILTVVQVHVEYALTERGQRLRPIFEAMARWALLDEEASAAK